MEIQKLQAELEECREQRDEARQRVQRLLPSLKKQVSDLEEKNEAARKELPSISPVEKINIEEKP